MSLQARWTVLVLLSLTYPSLGTDAHEDATEPVSDRDLLLIPSGTGSSTDSEEGASPDGGDTTARPSPKSEDFEYLNRYPFVCSYRDDQYRNYYGCGRTDSEAREEAYRNCRARNSYWDCFSQRCVGRELPRRLFQRVDGTESAIWRSLARGCPY